MTPRIRERTQVGIVGAGPSGLLLSHLLYLAGIESVILEDRTRRHVEERIRAGVIEHGAANLLVDAGVGERLKREGLRHTGIELHFEGEGHRIDLAELTGGKAVTVYGQHEVVKDLIAARLAAKGRIVFEAKDVAVDGFAGTSPTIRFVENGTPKELACDYIAGCDGFHGTCRPSVPVGELRFFDRTYPFGWLGILAKSPPVSASTSSAIPPTTSRTGPTPRSGNSSTSGSATGAVAGSSRGRCCRRASPRCAAS